MRWLVLAALLAAGCGDDGGSTCGAPSPACTPDDTCGLLSQDGRTITCRCGAGRWECHYDCPADINRVYCSQPTCGDFHGCVCSCNVTWTCVDDDGQTCRPEPPS